MARVRESRLLTSVRAPERAVQIKLQSSKNTCALYSKLDVKTADTKIVDATTALSMKVDAKKADAKKADAKTADAKKDGSKRAQALKADVKSTDDKAKGEARVAAKKNTNATDDR